MERCGCDLDGCQVLSSSVLVQCCSRLNCVAFSEYQLCVFLSFCNLSCLQNGVGPVHFPCWPARGSSQPYPGLKKTLLGNFVLSCLVYGAEARMASVSHRHTPLQHSGDFLHRPPLFIQVSPATIRQQFNKIIGSGSGAFRHRELLPPCRLL
jgi:hypothetical protein